MGIRGCHDFLGLSCSDRLAIHEVGFNKRTFLRLTKSPTQNNLTPGRLLTSGTSFIIRERDCIRRFSYSTS